MRVRVAVNCTEFCRALSLLGVPCSRAESEELFDDLDLDLSGELEYRELYKQLREKLDGSPAVYPKPFSLNPKMKLGPPPETY